MKATANGKTPTATYPDKLGTPQLQAIQLRIAAAATVLPLPADTDLQVWAARFILMASGSVQRGLSAPWYMARHREIEHEEGGHHEVIGIVAGIALALLHDDPTLTERDACWQAGNEWRASIRSQWDGRAGDKQALSIQRMVESVNGNGDLINERLGLVDLHPVDMAECQPDSRLAAVQAALPLLSDKQYIALELHSQGMTYTAIAEEMGLNQRQGAYAWVRSAVTQVQAHVDDTS